MGKKLSITFKIIGIIIAVIIIFNEVFVYSINAKSWAKLNCKNTTNCLKILLVADPQLIGEENEIFHFITPISIWDSDRFLRKTYSLVVDHFSPEVVIFLGDLFDEGSIATTPQYIRYVKRLFSIFPTEYPTTHIWLPGDNDVGGENNERVSQEKVSRFKFTFDQPDIIEVKNVRFNKINRMLRNSPKSFAFVSDKNKKNSLSVAVSHMPLVLVPSSLVDKIVEKLQPKLIFAAHEHKAMLVRTNVWQQYRTIDDLSEHNNQIYEYKLEDNKIFEILAPTCSYRMGSIDIGYGAVIIENNDTVKYTVFWSPNRFFYLRIYYLLTIIICAYLCVTFIIKKLYHPRIIQISKQQYSYKIIKNGV